MSRRRKSKRSEQTPDRRDSKVAGNSSSQSETGWNWILLVGLLFVAVGVGYWILRDQSNQTAEQIQLESKADAGNRTQSSIKTVSAITQDPLPVLATDIVLKEQELSENQLDPGQDGWETEVVAEEVKHLLTRLAGRLGNHDVEPLTPSEIAEGITVGRLRPQNLAEVYRDGGENGAIAVLRAAESSEGGTTAEGYEALTRAIEELAEPFAEATDVHVHFKVIRVSGSEQVTETTAYFEADAKTPTGSLQQRATWICQWQRSPEGALQLASIDSKDFEEVVERGPWLVDCTKAMMEKNRSFQEQLAYGLNHWLLRLGRVHGIHVFARNGMSLGDVNGDGRDDVYVCQPGGLPNRLFIQQDDGTVLDRSKESGVDWLDHTSSALVVDLDNDGDQDMVAATSAGLLVMENDGSGKFRLRSTLATRDIDTQSFSAADFDNDGDLDLYVCIEFARPGSLHSEAEVAFVYHDANDGAANVLFRNDIEAGGKWEFADVTKEVGLDTDNRRHSLACAWEDYDNDGDQDLYVANDYGQNCLYRNDEGKFKNIALEANVVDSASGMSVSWGDYNHDGWMDLYVANMFSSAGNRITRQEQFKSGKDDELKKIYSRFAKGNTLLQNDGQGVFREVSSETGVEMARWAWSSVFADINNDAWDDLLVANGYITTDDTGDL